MVARKGCNDRWNAVVGWIGVVSHRLQSLSGGIAYIILCACVCRVGYLNVEIREPRVGV